MKKVYGLPHPKITRGHAIKIISRRIFGSGGHSNFVSTAYKTDGDEPDDKRTEKDLLDAFDVKLQKELATRATKEQFEAVKAEYTEMFKDFPLDALRSLVDDKGGVMQLVTRQGLEIQKLLAKQGTSSEPKDMSIRGQIKTWLESSNEVDQQGNDVEGSKKVSDVVKQLRTIKSAELRPLELYFPSGISLQTRSNNPMLPSNTYGGSAYLPMPEFVPGINEIVRPDPTFWDYIPKGSSSSALLVWVNKKNPLGSAAWIAPGVYKPNISFTIGTQTSNAKKIAANEKIAIELLDDIDGFAGWVEQELMYQVKQKASLTLMSATGDTETPAGIQTLSVPFAFDALGLTTTNPNMWDVVRSGVAQLRRANLKGSVTAFVNPIDMANAVMTKAQNQGQLFIPPVTGATIVEDNNIEPGQIQMAILDNYKVKIYKGFTMTWGLENNDFTKNLRTVIGEMRIHQYFSENFIGSFLYDSIQNGIDQLTPGA